MRCWQPIVPVITLLFSYCWGHYLPQSSVPISIAYSELVPLLGKHNLVDLGKNPCLSHSCNLQININEKYEGSRTVYLGGVTPLPDRHCPVLAPGDVKGEVGVGHESPHPVTLLPLDHVT